MWYVIQVQCRHEAETAEMCQARAARDGEKVFVMMSERLMRKTDGIWEKRQQVAFPGYIFAETGDIQGLRIRLRDVGTMMKVLAIGDEMKPIFPEEEELLRNLGGEEHIIRSSEGFKAGEKLVVTDGPLKGYEGRIKWVNIHRKIAAIEIEILGQKVVVKLGIEFLKKVRGEPEK